MKKLLTLLVLCLAGLPAVAEDFPVPAGAKKITETTTDFFGKKEVSIFEYDRKGKLVTKTYVLEDVVYKVFRYSYNASGKLVYEQRYEFPKTAGPRDTTFWSKKRFTYDASGNCIFVVDSMRALKKQDVFAIVKDSITYSSGFVVRELSVVDRQDNGGAFVHFVQYDRSWKIVPKDGNTWLISNEGTGRKCYNGAKKLTLEETNKPWGRVLTKTAYTYKNDTQLVSMEKVKYEGDQYTEITEYDAKGYPVKETASTKVGAETSTLPPWTWTYVFEGNKLISKEEKKEGDAEPRKFTYTYEFY